MKVKMELKMEELLRARDNEESIPANASCKLKANQLWCELRYQKDDNILCDRPNHEKKRGVVCARCGRALGHDRDGTGLCS